MIEQLRNTINGYFVGKEQVVDNVLICLLAGGHILLEDIPGVGKTTLARTLAKATGCDFGRIQFTPDTLPTDVLGVSVYNRKTEEFEYNAGAIMHSIVLADEINRTSPKTQAGMLEAMEERQVTVDGVTYALPEPFLVIATQNPIEYLGTYPLPEAQLDRFMMRLTIGYPDREAELKLATNFLAGKRADGTEAVCTAADIVKMQKEVATVHCSEGVVGYARDIVDLTRQEASFVTGTSPRGMLMLLRAAQARAYMEGREYVLPDDVKAVAVPCLHHRMSLTAEARIRKESVDKVIERLVLKAKVPMVTVQ